MTGRRAGDRRLQPSWKAACKPLVALAALGSLAACGDPSMRGLDRFPTAEVEKIGPTSFRVSQMRGERPTIISRDGFDMLCGPLGLQASRITADAPAGSNPRPFILECGTTPLA